MPVQPHRPDRLERRVFRGSFAVRQGLVTRNQLRSTAWVRVRHDIYADSRLEIDHAMQCRVALLDLPDSVAIAGASAARLLGVVHAADASSPVHVILPPGRRMAARKGVIVHATTLEDDDRDERYGIPITSGLRTAWDLARWLPMLDAVPILDTLLALGVVRRNDLDAYLAAHVGLRGSARASIAFGLVDGGAQSPPESRVRVRLRQAGVPKPVAQGAVRVGIGLVLHPDLVWEEYKVALEYDGSWHDSPGQFHHDRKRLNLLTSEGWLVIHATSQRVRDDFPGLVREIKSALRSRGWSPRSR